nr:DUF6531 domain-containing protein [Chlamydiales bacterium]
MLRLLFLFVIIFTANTQAQEIQETPKTNTLSSEISEFVNPITGEFCYQTVDWIIPGKEPISLTRSYYSNQSKKSLGGWKFFHHLKLNVKKDDRIKAFEPTGEEVQYLKKGKIYYPDSKIAEVPFKNNLSQEEISGSTNIKNQRILYSSIQDQYELQTSNNTKRVYRNYNGEYCLYKELLPNTHIIEYQYDHLNRLIKISSHNHSSKTCFASMTFNYIQENLNLIINVTGSDGKNIQYLCKQLNMNRKKETHRSESFYIVKTNLPGGLIETYDYEIIHKNEGPLLNHIKQKNSKEFKIKYHKPQKISAGERDPLEFKVSKILKKTINDNWKTHVRFKYKFHPDLVTTCEYPQKRLTKHFYNELLKKDKTEYFIYKDKKYFLHHYEEILWGKGKDYNNIIEQTSYNSLKKPIVRRIFEYDHHGNITKEILEGEICQKNSLDRYIKYYQYSNDPFNLLIEESENGLKTTYTYLPNTNLLTQKLIHDKKKIRIRNFYHYDANYCLIKKITDDGSGLDSQDLTEVSERCIQSIQVDPATHMPIRILEKYLDTNTQDEIIQKRTELSYSSSMQICEKHIFSSNHRLIESYSYEYSDSNQLLKSTDLLEKASTLYHYNAFQNVYLIENLFDQTSTMIEYDELQRKIKTTQNFPLQKPQSTTLTYNDDNQIISEIDSCENLQKFEYDGFGNITKTSFPKLYVSESQYIIPITRNYYDCHGNIIKKIDSTGQVFHSQYSILKKPFLISFDKEKTINHYYPSGQLKKTISEDGSYTCYEYDFLNRITKKSHYTKTDSKKFSESFKYNAFHLLKETDRYGNNTEYRYDCQGNLVEKKFNGHSLIEYQYDELNRPYKTIEHTNQSKHNSIISIDKFNTKNQITDHLIYDSS